MINLFLSLRKWPLFLKRISRKTSGIGSLPFEKNYTLCETVDHNRNESHEIHALGLKEVARLNAEMEKVKTQVGLKEHYLNFLIT
jgi:uncharacterized protein (DUF885 family)